MKKDNTLQGTIVEDNTSKGAPFKSAFVDLQSFTSRQVDQMFSQLTLLNEQKTTKPISYHTWLFHPQQKQDNKGLFVTI